MKFFGKVGFWIQDQEVSPGVFESKMVERTYYGDILRRSQNWQTGDQKNDNFKVNNSITIVSDLFAQRYFASIKYVVWNNVRLKVTSVTEDYPTLTLEIGGMYNDKVSTNVT